MPRWLAHLLNPVVKLVYPHTSDCLRCQLSWRLTKEHITHYPPSTGCLPLCEHCWQELGTPEQRLPYYLRLFDSWGPEDRTKWEHNHTEWEHIRRAVLDGK